MTTAANGKRIVRVGMEGFVTFVFGDEGSLELPIRVDVIATFTDYLRMDASFRDEKGEVSVDRQTEYARAIFGFYADLIMNYARDNKEEEKGLAVLDSSSVTTAMQFIARLREEANRLQSFFEVRTPEKPSSPASSATTRFST